MLGMRKLEERLCLFGNRMDVLQSEWNDTASCTAMLSGRLEAIECRATAEQKRQDDQSLLVVQLVKAVERLEGLVAEQAVALVDREEFLQALLTTNERQGLAIEQLKTDLMATRLQAERDLTEMRETNQAIAATILLR